MNKVLCDRCNKKFKIKVKKEKLAGGVEKTFFICPRCKTEFIVHYTDTNIRAKMERLKLVRSNYRKTSDLKQVDKLFRLIDKLKREIIEDMKKLETELAS